MKGGAMVESWLMTRGRLTVREPLVVEPRMQMGRADKTVLEIEAEPQRGASEEEPDCPRTEAEPVSRRWRNGEQRMA